MNDKGMDKELFTLESHEVKTSWRENAEYRRKNRRWLRYSGFIAMAVSSRLKELGLSQKDLAQKMDSSPQYISKLLRGNENLTLETIAKLEDCLEMDLVKTALTYVNGYSTYSMESLDMGAVAQPDPKDYIKGLDYRK